ncbi:MAG: glycosyltransferase, partial [Patescibacteria group bacterium]
MAKIALNMIVAPRDKEADELNRCLKSVAKGVDGIFITITGKNKKVERMARKWGAKISYFDWIKDFSAARNFALSQVPKEYDWIFWCDADDVVHGAENLHTVAEMAEAGNFSAIFCTYFYEVVLDPTRSCPDCGLHPAIRRVIIQHLRERLVRNDSSHKWIGEVHETMIEQRPTNKTDNNSFSVIHLATSEDRHGAILRNAEILENKLLKEEGKDPRTLFYLAKAYFDLHDDELYYMAYELTKDYLRKSGWSEE